MFVGHYSVSWLAKRADDTIPLWVLFVAVQLVDVVWAVLVLAGVEKVRIVPGITATNPLDLYFMPYTHSLVAAVGWSAVAAIAYRLATSRRARGSRASVLVGLAVFSHWPLDVLVHRPDMPIWDDAAKVGLGLWNRPALAFGLEALFLLSAVGLWLARRPARRIALVLFSLVMIALQAGVFFGPPTGSGAQIALTALVAYVVYAAIAWRLVDRGGARRAA